MTHEQLKKKLTEIVTNETLTKVNREELLAETASLWLNSSRSPEAFEVWNLIMVEIVTTHNLRRH